MDPGLAACCLGSVLAGAEVVTAAAYDCAMGTVPVAWGTATESKSAAVDEAAPVGASPVWLALLMVYEWSSVRSGPVYEQGLNKKVPEVVMYYYERSKYCCLLGCYCASVTFSRYVA